MANSYLDLTRPSNLRSRSISAENRMGAPGAGARATEGTGAGPARHLGVGWKVSPSLAFKAGEVTVLADIAGPGVIQHLWISAPPEWWRLLVFRFHWDGEEEASIEVPFGDFFGLSWGEYTPISSKFVVTAPYCALNSYWPMPFRDGARVTVENLGSEDVVSYYYIDYAEGEVPPDAMYLHATWKNSNPVLDGVHELLNVRGAGKYVGTYLAVGVNHPGWWGEGEIKFYLDDDTEYPTICGTGTEDYFGGAWDFEVPGHGYTPYSTPYLGLHQIIRPDGLYRSQQRFGMYRWHELDCVNFESALRVTIQDLGWASEDEYLVRSDHLMSTTFWYSPGKHGAASDRMTRADLLVGSHPSETVHP